MEWFTDDNGEILLGSYAAITADLIIPAGVYVRKENKFSKQASPRELSHIGNLAAPRKELINQVKQVLLDANPVINMYLDDTK